MKFDLNEINLFMFFEILVRVFGRTCSNTMENTRNVSQLTYEEETFLNGCRFWSVPNLFSEHHCKKGCITHTPCRAYHHNDDNGCALCVTEVKESNVYQPELTDIVIDLTKFERFFHR